MRFRKELVMRFVIPSLSLAFAFLFIFATSINAGTFFDDFNDGKADGWHVFAGEWKVVDGEYHMPVDVNTPPYPTTYAFDGKEFGEFIIEAKVRNDKFHSTMNQSHAGFAFGMDDKGNGWVVYFRYHSEGSLVLKTVSGDGKTYSGDIENSGNVIEIGDKEKWHVLKAEVSAQNDTLKAWVDGKEAIDTKQEINPGKLGLWAADIGAASFDDVSITGANIPASDVDPASKLSTTWGSIKAQY